MLDNTLALRSSDNEVSCSFISISTLVRVEYKVILHGVMSSFVFL